MRTYSALSLFYFAAGKQIIAMKEMITEKPSENRKMIRVDISKSLELLPQKTEYYGIDNVCHETHMYSFAFKLGEFEYCEQFQEIQDPEALILDMEDGALETHGILSSQFFMKYRACFSYDTMEMFFTAPDNSN